MQLHSLEYRRDAERQALLIRQDIFEQIRIANDKIGNLEKDRRESAMSL